jgi:hypothetical protein
MTHAQKSDFVFRRNGRVHLNRQGCQISRLLAAEMCVSAVVMLDTPSSELVKGTGCPLHSPVSPSLPFPCVTVYHRVSTGLFQWMRCNMPEDMNFHQHSCENLKHPRHVLANVFGGITAKNGFVRLSKVCVSKIRTVSHRGGPGSVPDQYMSDFNRIYIYI